MKKLLLIALSVFSLSAFAASVKITSFTYVSNAGNMAELCGLVENMAAAPTFIKVVVDPGSRRPASYNAIAGDDGKFCMAVVTLRGTAEAALFGETTFVKASAQ